MKFIGYRGDPCKGPPELNPAGVFLALDPNVASIYGYARQAIIVSGLKILHFNTLDMPAYQERWKQYCAQHRSVNSKAFPGAFILKKGVVFRDSEFLKDSVVMAFFKDAYYPEYGGVYFHELPTLVDGQPHHEELFLFDSASVTLSSEIVELDYNDDQIKEMWMRKQRAILTQKNKNKKRLDALANTLGDTLGDTKKKLFF